MQTANGKAILFGEHFVVYKTRAVAVAIEPGAEAEAADATTPALVVPQWDFDTRRAPQADLSRAFRTLRHRMEQAYGECPPTIVRVQCHLPAGAGLGSSGAIGVAVARALIERHGWTARVSEEELHDIVMAWESVFHGKPSGFDHAVSMRQGAIVSDPEATPRFSTVRPGSTLHFTIVVPESGASTAEMVAGVAEFRRVRGAEFRRILHEARVVIDAGISALASSETRVIGELMTRNHELLSQIGVSSPALDAWVERLRSWGADGAKLTGAGGGGAVIAVAATAEMQLELVRQARAENLVALAATVPAK